MIYTQIIKLCPWLHTHIVFKSSSCLLYNHVVLQFLSFAYPCSLNCISLISEILWQWFTQVIRKQINWKKHVFGKINKSHEQVYSLQNKTDTQLAIFASNDNYLKVDTHPLITTDYFIFLHARKLVLHSQKCEFAF